MLFLPSASALVAKAYDPSAKPFERSSALAQQQIISYFSRAGRSLDEFAYGPATYIAGDENVAAATDDPYGLLHSRLRTSIDDRIVRDAAAEAVFQLNAAIQRVENLAIGYSAILAANESDPRAMLLGARA